MVFPPQTGARPSLRRGCLPRGDPRRCEGKRRAGNCRRCRLRCLRWFAAPGIKVGLCGITGFIIICHSLRLYHNMSPPDPWKWKWSNDIPCFVTIIIFISFLPMSRNHLPTKSVIGENASHGVPDQTNLILTIIQSQGNSDNYDCERENPFWGIP